MHVHEVCGSWMEHAFWRSSFLIRDDRLLRRLATVGHIVIDTDKGLDIVAEAPPHGGRAGDGRHRAAPAAVADAPVVLKEAQPPAAIAATSFQTELAHARCLVRHSRAAMASLYADARMARRSMPGIACTWSRTSPSRSRAIPMRW